jgi:hypothetical protein
VTFNENAKRASKTVQLESVADDATVTLHFDDRERLPIVTAFYEYLSIKLQEFINWPMTAYTTDVQTYNSGRRAKSLIEFRSACWAAKICTAADITMLRAIEKREQHLPRTFFPRLEVESRFHNIPRTEWTDCGKTSGKVFPYTQPVQSSFESLRGTLPTSQTYASLPTQNRTSSLHKVQALPARRSSLANTSKPLMGQKPPYIQLAPVLSQNVHLPRPLESPPQRSPPSLRREPRRIQDHIRKPPREGEHHAIRRDAVSSAGLMAKQKRLHDPLRIERKPTIRRPTYEGLKRLFSSSSDDETFQIEKERVVSNKHRLLESGPVTDAAIRQRIVSTEDNAENNSSEEGPDTVIRHGRCTRYLLHTPLNQPVLVNVAKAHATETLAKRLEDASIEDRVRQDTAHADTIREGTVREPVVIDNPWTPLQSEYHKKLRKAAQEASITLKSASSFSRGGFWY